MKKLSFFIIITLLFSSCSKLIDIPPLTSISTTQYWNTAADLEHYTLQYYTAFPTFRNGSGYTGNIGQDGYNGCDFQITATPATVLNGTKTKVTSGGAWSWGNIRSVNIFLENYSKVKDLPVKVNQFIGEAYFFKAWFYYGMVRNYGNVPWYSHSIQMNDTLNLYKARTPRTEVMDSVLACLDKAVAYLSYLKDVNGGNNRLSKEAALIFKSRVALYEGSWQKYHAGTAFGTPGANPAKYFQASVNAVTELMTPGKYKVGIYNTGKPANDYNTLFSSTNLASNTEVVLWAKFDKTQSQLSHNFQQYITQRCLVSVTMELIRNYLKKDGTPYDYSTVATTTKGAAFLSKIATECDPRMTQTIWIPGQTLTSNTIGTVIFTKPYIDKSGEFKNFTGFQMRKGADPSDPTAGDAQGFSTACETGAVIFRYAEALLNYAEAQAELGQPVDYANSLNLLRKRAGMPDFAAVSDPYRTSYADYGYPLSDQLYEIRRERAVELACEGFRYDDWRRWRAHNLFKSKRPGGYPYLAADYSPAPSGLFVTNGFIDFFKNALPNGYQFNENRDYLECIPTNEITLNPKLTQNPGW